MAVLLTRLVANFLLTMEVLLVLPDGTLNVQSFRGSVASTSSFVLSGGALNVSSLQLFNADFMSISGGAMSVTTIDTWDGQIDFTSTGGSLTVNGYDLAAFQAEYTKVICSRMETIPPHFNTQFTVTGNTLTRNFAAVPELSNALAGIGILLFGLSYRRRLS